MAKFNVTFLSASKDSKEIEADDFEIKDDMVTFWSQAKGKIATFPKASIESIEQV